MEKKNMVLLTVIAVATLLVAVVGATFAYFTASITNNYNGQGTNGNANIQSGNVGENTTVVANVAGQAGSFEAENVYPGHKEVAALQVTVEGDAAQSIDIVYTPSENTFPDGNITLKVYKAKGSENIGTEENYFQCEPQTGDDGSGNQTFFETCAVEESTLGTQLGTTHQLTQAEKNTTIPLATDSLNATTGIYYVVIEFVNDEDAAQDEAQSKALTGQISVRLTP